MRERGETEGRDMEVRGMHGRGGGGGGGAEEEGEFEGRENGGEALLGERAEEEGRDGREGEGRHSWEGELRERRETDGRGKMKKNNVQRWVALVEGEAFPFTPSLSLLRLLLLFL